MSKKQITVKNLGIEYLKAFSGLTLKAIKEKPDFSFMCIFSRCDLTTKDDVRQLTGLNEKEYHKIFEKAPEDNWRFLKTGALANETLLGHLGKEWITEAQHLVSSLMWKFMQTMSLEAISDQFELITEDRLEDVCPEYFEDGRFDITLEEVNDAIILSMDTLQAIVERRNK